MSDTGSLLGRIQLQRGEAGVFADDGRLKPADFRLQPGSTGKGAGKDGQDLGADVDLVGPGPAYERWQKSADYQEWLKSTGQVK